MRLLLFDFDGVLADTFMDMIQFAQETCDELGVLHIVIPADLRDLEVMSFATFGRACEVPEKLVEEFVRHCTGKFAKKKKPPAIFDGLPDVIRKLSEKNNLAVVTGNTTENVHSFLNHHGLQDCFHMVYGLDMPGTKVEKIKKAKEQFAAGNETTYFIGDSLSDIHAAREANVRSIAVGWGHQSLEMLVRAEPNMIVPTPTRLLDIPNPYS